MELHGKSIDEWHDYLSTARISDEAEKLPTEENRFGATRESCAWWGVAATYLYFEHAQKPAPALAVGRLAMNYVLHDRASIGRFVVNDLPDIPPAIVEHLTLRGDL